MCNKWYENPKKWVDKKYKLKNENCKECKEETKIWGERNENDSSKDIRHKICFEHLWNNPYYAKEQKRDNWLMRMIMVAIMIVCCSLSFIILFEIEKNIVLLLLVIFLMAVLNLIIFSVLFYVIRETKRIDKTLKKYAKDWKKLKN